MATDSATPYRVLARKYRPSTFAELVGQDALVRTLTNAIESGRLAHAYMLTGVRGVGKTTAARIIARALNCVGPDGTGEITAEPCGICEQCEAIAGDRHVDVIEMDAASRTGVDDIRELIDGVRYRPVMARYKVYIIDEVHMLSRNAFNALLKTLEEPPEHVRFVFATTEIRKVPVTVPSRRQRFDLRRIDMAQLVTHFTDLTQRESVETEDEAIRIIARAADGSVRDGLSLLDQAIALGNATVTAAQVQDMLGLADRTAVFDLFDSLMKGDIAAALDLMQSLRRDGADPVTVLQDLLEVTYWVTRIKITPDVADAAYTPEVERTRGKEMAEALGMPVLTRTWQILLKGLEETMRATAPHQAADMVLVRLAYAADLPPPAELARQVMESAPTDAAAASAPQAPAPAPVMATAGGAPLAMPQEAPPEAAPAPETAPEPMLTEPETAKAAPQSFREVADLFGERREAGIKAQLQNSVHLVNFDIGRIEFRPTEHAPRDLASRVGGLLSDWTGIRWVVSISREAGESTLADQDAATQQQMVDDAETLPLVQAVKSAFPGASIRKVTSRGLLDEFEDPDGILNPDADAADDNDMDDR
jgi:DNA polymerase-3 subunit gamma/tau